MEQLLINSRLKIERVSLHFRRYFLDSISWKSKLIALKGARGVGKTTLLLQHAATHLPKDKSVLYISMDDLFFSDNSLLELTNKFVQNGGKYLLLDEVHKYLNWSREIKLIYDNHPELSVVFTSSSILEIYKSESDLSRRAVSYELKELSLREYIELETKIKLPVYSLIDITENHVDISMELIKKIKPIKSFNEFLKNGSYPYFKEDEETYYQKLMNTVNLIIEIDIFAVKNIDYALVSKLKRLLYAVATSAPFTPNISKLSERIGVSRQTLILALNYLEKSRLIFQLNKPSKGIGLLSKPDKIYLNNTNLIYAIAKEMANPGNLRETFFVNQLSDIATVNVAKKADFIVNEKYTFELGGKSKNQKQIKNLDNAFIVKDDIEIGIDSIIPLWLFGFLY